MKKLFDSTLDSLMVVGSFTLETHESELDSMRVVSIADVRADRRTRSGRGSASKPGCVAFSTHSTPLAPVRLALRLPPSGPCARPKANSASDRRRSCLTI
jgi:hypothetical protein